MILLDTSVLIEIIRKNITVIEKCDELGVKNLSISSISFCEFLIGSKDKNDMAQNLKFLKKFHLVKTNETIDDIFVSLYEKYCLSHRPGIPDILIAATSLHYDLRLYTINKKDFHYIPGIHLIS